MMKNISLIILLVLSFRCIAQLPDTVFLQFSDNPNNTALFCKLNVDREDAKIKVVYDYQAGQIIFDTVMFAPQVTYRGFALENNLLPENLRLKLPQNSIETINTSNYKSKKISLKRKRNQNLLLPENQPLQSYSDEDLARIRSFLALVDSFFIYKNKVSEYGNFLNNTYPADLQIKELKSFRDYLARNKYIILQAGKYESLTDTMVDYSGKLLKLHEKKANETDSLLSAYSQALTQQANINIREDNYEGAIAQLHKALEIDPQNADALLLLTEIMFKTNNYAKAHALAIQLYNSRLDNEQFRRKDSLGKELFDTYVAIAADRVSHGEHDKALMWLAMADKLCSLSYTLFCGEKYDSLLNTAVDSLLSPVLTGINQAIASNDYMFATQLLIKARDTLPYFTHVASDTLNKLTNLLYSRLNRTIEGYLSQNDYTGAEKYISVLDNLCIEAQAECEESSPDLPQLRRREIMSIIRTNDSLLIAGDYAQVNANIEKMRFLNKKYKLEVDHLIRDEQKRYYHLLAVEKYEEAKKAAENKNCEKTLEILKTVKKYNPDFPLENLRVHCIEYLAKQILQNRKVKNAICLADSILSSSYLFNSEVWLQINTMSKKIQGEQCSELREKVTSGIYQSITLMEGQKYMEAEDRLHQILISVDNNTCCIHTYHIVKLLDSVKYPAKYQRLMASVYDRYVQGNYDAALSYLLDAVKLYQQHELWEYKLERPDLVKAIEGFDDEFVGFAASYLAIRDSLDQSYALLEYLRQNGVSAHKTRNAQSILGYRMALRDFSLNPSGRMKEDIREKQLKKHWYRFTLKSYIRQRKKMHGFYGF